MFLSFSFSFTYAILFGSAPTLRKDLAYYDDLLALPDDTLLKPPRIPPS
jgi:hypothetical protein